jgi:hypothetical protein
LKTLFSFFEKKTLPPKAKGRLLFL